MLYVYCQGGAKVFLNGATTPTVDCNNDNGPPKQSAWFTVDASNQVQSIRIEYRNTTSPGSVEFGAASQVYGPGPVPATWLSSTLPVLPNGWQLNGAPAGELEFSSAQWVAGGVILRDPDGGTHPYYTDDGYKSMIPASPNDQAVAVPRCYFVCALDVLGEDGMQYSFDWNGRLTSAFTTADDLHPAALTYQHNTTTSRLEHIVDPVMTGPPCSGPPVVGVRRPACWAGGHHDEAEAAYAGADRPEAA